MPGLKRLLQFLLIAGLALVVVAAAAPGASAPGGATPGTGDQRGQQRGDAQDEPAGPQPLHLHAARLTQDGSALVLRLSTSQPWSPASLRRDRQSLCLRLVYETSGFNSRDVCVRRRGRAATLTLARVLRDGGTGPLHELAARVAKPSPRALTARLSPERIGIPFGPLRWRALSSTDGCRIADGTDCFEALPADGAVLSLRAPQPIGCIPAGPAFVTSGPRSKQAVALTFDDGPSSYTPAVLDVLRAKGARGTFFMIGQQVAPNAALVRRMLVEGHEPADHTWNHANVSAGGSAAAGSITSTAAAIQSASGFRPCSFRAPYGAVGSSLIGLVRGLGMTTVQWDVDPQDWMTPGAEAIYSRIVGKARAGSIILMHDGGGSRSQTLTALPRVIDTLRARGYRFVTVSELLGNTPTFG